MPPNNLEIRKDYLKFSHAKLNFALAILFIVLFAGLIYSSLHVNGATSRPRYATLNTLAAVEQSVRVESNTPVTLLFVGDIMLSRQIGILMKKYSDWSYPFQEIALTTQSADIAFANLEGPIAAGGANQGSMYSFRDDPGAIEGLTYAGFDVLSIANNHIWDYGPEAFQETIDNLRRAGISPVGGGMNFSEAYEAVIKNIRGTRIAFLGYSKLVPPSRTQPDSVPASAYPDIATMTSDIQTARQESDVVVVSFHWGNEYEIAHDADQEMLAHAAIDAGAALIIGHHPHVVEDTESYHGGFIAYSLGNFVFDQNFSADTKNGLVIRVTIRDRSISDIEELPIYFTATYQPFLAVP